MASKYEVGRNIVAVTENFPKDRDMQRWVD